MPRISAVVNGVTYVVGGWSSYELSRRKIEHEAATSFGAIGGVEKDSSILSPHRFPTNNEYIGDILYSARKQVMTPLLMALKTMKDNIQSLESTVQGGALESTAMPTFTAEQIADLINFLSTKGWFHNVKHLYKFGKALEDQTGILPDMPIVKVDPMKEKYIDPHNKKTKAAIAKKLVEIEVMLATFAEYIDKVNHCNER